MRFGKTIKESEDPYFKDKYIDYAALKKLIKKELHRRELDGSQDGHDNRETSITVPGRDRSQRGGADFFDLLDKEVRSGWAGAFVC